MVCHRRATGPRASGTGPGNSPVDLRKRIGQPMLDADDRRIRITDGSVPNPPPPLRQHVVGQIPLSPAWTPAHAFRPGASPRAVWRRSIRAVRRFASATDPRTTLRPFTPPQSPRHDQTEAVRATGSGSALSLDPPMDRV